MEYLLSVSIGPVQEFIATARRSRDLWFGSWLLSELSKAAAAAIVANQEDKLDRLIFPAITKDEDLKPDSQFNVVNKILAVVEVTNQADIADFGGKIETAVKERLKSIRNQAWERINDDEFFAPHRHIAERQVKDLIEVFWAAVPLQDYEQSRNEVEATLIARKATRDFERVGWGSDALKSSLDGQRESVIDRAAYPSRDDDSKLRAKKIRRLFERYHVREGERLCGVGLLKRLGNRQGDDSFFSTSHVAALPLMSAVADKVEVRNYVKRLREIGVKSEDLHGVPQPPSKQAYPPAFIIPAGEKHTGRAWDGHILFEERLREYFDMKSAEGKKQFQDAKKALRDFLNQALPEPVRGQAPLPYYALLHADGDRMGVAINTQSTRDSHQKLSVKLSRFAKDVVKIVEDEYHGSLVYSGGDDVLAFLPLHTALDCAHKLAEQFKEELGAFEFEEKGEKRSPSLSIGIAITHHIEPLSDALELARAAEKEAKAVKDKDALCIKVSKRGGETTTAVGKWGKIDERLQRFIALHRLDAIADGAAYELRDLAESLNRFPDEKRKEAAALETNRILKRKRAAHGQTSVADDVRHALVEMIKKDEVSLSQLANELVIARLFADALEQAEPKKLRKQQEATE